MNLELVPELRHLYPNSRFLPAEVGKHSLSTVGPVHFKATEFRISSICHICQLKVIFQSVIRAQIPLTFVVVDP